VPLCQHANHALDTDSTVVPIKLRRIVTELRGCQRAQLAEFIEWQFWVQQFQLFRQRWGRQPEHGRREPKYWWWQ
tara:strand:- start:36 stop:260 length:225 start_codon:yes stop_codon:yes gene_type:complete